MRFVSSTKTENLRPLRNGYCRSLDPTSPRVHLDIQITIIARAEKKISGNVRSHSRAGEIKPLAGGQRRLSAEPFSYRYLVAKIVTTTPTSPRWRFPKNDPRCVLGSGAYRPIHKTRIESEAMLSECSCYKIRFATAPFPTIQTFSSSVTNLAIVVELEQKRKRPHSPCRFVDFLSGA